MSRVGRALAPGRIRLGFSAATKSQVLEEAGRLFAAHEGWRPAYIAERLGARERVGSTGLGQGVAIPHARLEGLHQAVAAFIRLDSPVAFDAPDGKPVSDFLVLLVPEQAGEEHLQLLAEAAEMFNDRRFRDALRRRDDAAGVHRVFAQWPAVTD